MDSGSDFESVNLSDVEEASSSAYDTDTDPSLKPKSKTSTPTKNPKLKATAIDISHQQPPKTKATAVDISSQQQSTPTQTQTATQQSSQKRFSMSSRLAVAREARRRRAEDSVAEARQMEEEQRQEDALKRRQLQEAASRTQKDKTDKKAPNISTQKQKDPSSVSRDHTPDITKRATAKQPSASSPSSKTKRVSKKQALVEDRRKDAEKDNEGAQEEKNDVVEKKAQKGIKKKNVPGAAQKEKEKDAHPKVVKSQIVPQSQPAVTVVEPIRKKERPLAGAAKASAERKRKQMEEAARKQLATDGEDNEKTGKKRKESSVASLNDHSKAKKINEQDAPSPKRATKKARKATTDENADNDHEVAPSKKKDAVKNPDPKTKKKTTDENGPVPKVAEKKPRAAPHTTPKNAIDVDKRVSKDKVQAASQTKKIGRGNPTATVERKQSHPNDASSEEDIDEEDDDVKEVNMVGKSFSPRSKKNRRIEKPNEDSTKNAVERVQPVETSSDSDESESYEKQSPRRKENGTFEPRRQVPARKIDRRQSMPAYSSPRRAGRSQNDLRAKGVNMLDALEKEYLLFVQRQDHVIDNFFTDIGVSSNPLQMLNSVMTPIRQFTHAERGFLRDERLQTRINAAKWELRLSLHEKLEDFAKKVSTALTDVQKGEASSLRDLVKEQIDTKEPLVTPFKVDSPRMMTKESPVVKRRISAYKPPIPLDHDDEEMKDSDDEDEMEEDSDEEEGELKKMTNMAELKKMKNVAELKEYLGTSYKRLGLNCYRSEAICKLCDTPKGMTVDEIKKLTPMGQQMLKGKLNALEGNNLIYKQKIPQKDGTFKTVYITNESIRHLR